MAHKKKMNAAALAAYKAENENFLANLRGRAGIQELRCGVLYKVVQTAPAPPADADERTLRRHNATPAPRSVVTVHYEGRSSTAAPRLLAPRRRHTARLSRQRLITGWQVALVNMHIGDIWELYVPASAGYGERGAGRDIPGHSTLIFRIELLDIA